METIFKQMFSGYLIEICSNPFPSERPFVAFVDCCSIGRFFTFEDALDTARARCTALSQSALFHGQGDF